MTSVIIPALNEEATVAGVVSSFKPYVKYVLVGVDKETTDNTYDVAVAAGGITVATGYHGKGQVVTFTGQVLEVIDPVSATIVFCDADITELNSDDIRWLADESSTAMRILIPIPTGEPPPWKWTDAYPWVSGIRAVPRMLVDGMHFHGYLMETQLKALAHLLMVDVEFRQSKTARSPFRFTEARMEAMRTDREWGKEQGIL